MPTFGGIGFGGGGIKNANFTNTATGTYSSSGKNYKYISFLSSGSLTVDKEGLADILVVAGGGNGSGSGDGGSGGGAGGFQEFYGLFLPVGTYTVTVGGGGSAGGRGGSSSFGTLIYAWGGGQGGEQANHKLHDGGSGGGHKDGNVGEGVPGQGFNGSGVSPGGGAGGGAGGAASGQTGGPGRVSTITGSSVTYATGGSKFGSTNPANSGNGGHHSGGGPAAGIVVVRVQI